LTLEVRLGKRNLKKSKEVKEDVKEFKKNKYINRTKTSQRWGGKSLQNTGLI